MINSQNVNKIQKISILWYLEDNKKFHLFIKFQTQFWHKESKYAANLQLRKVNNNILNLFWCLNWS